MEILNKGHDLFDFMSQISQEMSSEYERIQKRATEDPGTAGDQGEENWAELLRDWLPSGCQVVTKGRIISHDGKTSPQIDVLVLKSSYPKKLLNKKIYLAAGVAAAFECKVTLKASHITEALENCIVIKSLFTSRKGSPFKELNVPITYGLLAHSHCWKGERSTPIENIENKLLEEDIRLVKHPRQMIDLICVADLGAWAASKKSFLVNNQSFERIGLSAPTNESGQTPIAITAYIGYTNKFDNQLAHFRPVGALILQLFHKLAWESEDYRSLADYYQETYLGGSGSGRIREWMNDIYSQEFQTKLERNLLGIERSIFSSGELGWDEWEMPIVP